MWKLRILLAGVLWPGVLWLATAEGQVTFSNGHMSAPNLANVPKREVTGTVVNGASGEPLQKALVTVQTPDGSHSAFSDASGRFALQNVPEGNYSLQAQKPGFFPPNNTSGFYSPRSQPFVTVSAATDPVTVKLMPAATVSGRVVDNAGQPVEGMTVQLFQDLLSSGRRTWQQNQGAATDEDGNYEIDNLQPGKYRVRLVSHAAPPVASTVPVPRSRMQLQVYPAQFFGGTEDAASAQAVVLNGGGNEHADFTVTPVPGFRIHGVVSPSGPGMFVRVEDENGADLGIGSMANPQTGQFVIAAVPNGNWRVVAQHFANGEQLTGEQSVSVNGADVQNVPLALGAALSIPVEIVNGPEDGSVPLQLRLIRDDAGRGQVSSAGFGHQSELVAFPEPPTPGSDGGKQLRLHFANVPAGHYRVKAQAFGQWHCIDSLRFGQAEVERDGLLISPGQASQPLLVSLRSDCASIQVKLNMSDENASAFALLTSDNPVFQTQLMNVLGSRGAQFPNLTPGSYRLYAVDSVDDLEWANPDVMNGLHATELSLESNGKAQVELDVQKRPKEEGNSREAR